MATPYGAPRSKRRSWLLIVLLCAAAVAALGLLTEQGRFYFRFPRVFWGTFIAMRDSALAGDAESQTNLGVFHANGQGVEQDYAEAAYWYKKAAEQDNARAMRNLALLYECGVGVKRNLRKAFDLYWRAAELGDAAAHMGVAGYAFTYREKIMPPELGRYNLWRLKAFYLVDLSFDHPFFETAFWDSYAASVPFRQRDDLVVARVRKMAEDDPESQLRMVQFHLQGQGVKIKNATTREWLERAAANGSGRASFALGKAQEGYSLSGAISDRRDFAFAAQGRSRHYGTIVDIRGDTDLMKRHFIKAAESQEEDLFVYTAAMLDPGAGENALIISSLAKAGYIPAVFSYREGDESVFGRQDYLEALESLAEAGDHLATMTLFSESLESAQPDYAEVDKRATAVFCFRAMRDTSFYLIISRIKRRMPSPMRKKRTWTAAPARIHGSPGSWGSFRWANRRARKKFPSRRWPNISELKTPITPGRYIGSGNFFSGFGTTRSCQKN